MIPFLIPFPRSLSMKTPNLFHTSAIPGADVILASVGCVPCASLAWSDHTASAGGLKHSLNLLMILASPVGSWWAATDSCAELQRHWRWTSCCAWFVSQLVRLGCSLVWSFVVVVVVVGWLHGHLGHCLPMMRKRIMAWKNQEAPDWLVAHRPSSSSESAKVLCCDQNW
jgi:hypothetical protein